MPPLHNQFNPAYPDNVPDGYTPIESSNTFGAINGPIFEKKESDGWVRGFMPEERHSNMAGIVHGGMLMTFADILLARAVLELAKPPFVTLRLVGDFVSPALKHNWVEGRARILSNDGGLYMVAGEVKSRSKLVLQVTGSFKQL